MENNLNFKWMNQLLDHNQCVNKIKEVNLMNYRKRQKRNKDYWKKYICLDKQGVLLNLIVYKLLIEKLIYKLKLQILLKKVIKYHKE